MTITLDGRKLSKELEIRLQSEIKQRLSKANRPPGLAVIRVGDDPASEVYVANKKRACERVGVKSFECHLPEGSKLEDIAKKISSFNNDDFVDGILLQLPLPKGLDEKNLLGIISPEKDADGLHALNLGKLLKGEEGPRSCTPAGVMALLSNYEIPLKGKRAVVIGRSILVGKPMSLMLQAANATVTTAHSHTQNLAQITNQADLLVVAAGVPQMIDSTYIKEGAVVVDVGIHRIANSESINNSGNTKLCGDVDFLSVHPLASAITPVPGGVGPMTVSMLLVNTLRSWQKRCGLPLTICDLLP